MGHARSVALEFDDGCPRVEPSFHRPMLAVRDTPRGPDHEWVHERKLDGERIVAVRDGDVRLYTRNGKDVTATYPQVVAALQAQDQHCFVLDGEVVAFDQAGQTSFERLQRRMHRDDRLARRATGVDVHYLVFDCLLWGDHDLRNHPLVHRKRHLENAVAFGAQVAYLPHRGGRGLDAIAAACSEGWEGLIVKRADAPYRSGRSRAWCKLKCESSETFLVVGFTPPRGSRVGIGALLLAEEDEDGTLHYVGKVGSGLSDALLEPMRRHLGEMQVDAPVVNEPTLRKEPIHWVEPRLHAEVSFAERTSAGRLRHPVFRGLRRDQGA